MANRRTVLIGLGGLVAGGGALIATGAFTTVEAQRTVTVETAGDADAFLAFSPARDDEAFVNITEDGLVEINIDDDASDDPDVGAGLNQRAITTFRNLVEVQNQGTQTIESLTLEFTEAPGAVDPDETFRFPVDEVGGDGQDMVDNGDDILTGDDGIPSELSPGEAINFGLEVDLIDGGDDQDLPEDGEYTVTITAEAEDD